MNTIKLSNSKYSFNIDDEDYDRVNQYSWSLGQDDTIHARVGNEVINIGRFILSYYGPNTVDHKDRDRFNNQKENLRLATRSQNQQNRKIPSQNTSGFKGVHWERRMNKWRARITVNKYTIHLGFFSDKIEAAKAYNKSALVNFGEFAVLNEVD